MATYSTTQSQLPNPQTNPRGATFTIFGTIDLTTALASGDVVQLCAVPNGHKVLEVLFDSDELDSNASPALTGTVGDSSANGRYVSVTAAQFHTGIITPNNVPASLGWVYTPATSGGSPGETIISFYCTHAAGTWQNGNMRLAVTLQVDLPSFA